MAFWAKMKRELIGAPSHELDPAMHKYVEAWNVPPTPLQILEVLDRCIHNGAASGFTVAALRTLYEMRCQDEGVTHEQLVPLAAWRNKDN